MPTEQPSNAPETIGTDAREPDTAAAVLHDDALDQTPGGGGLRGPVGADPLAGAGRTPRGTSPNAPIDTGVTPPEEDAAAGAESRAAAVENGGAGPHGGSQ